jgi:4-hydroxybenzoate polyprenyltransferase
MEGAEWVAAIRGLRMPADAPKRAALCALIPGMGAVYNDEYLKALTFFAVFASLILLGDKVHGVFGFGAFVFLVFTLFDAYRTAELHVRRRVESRNRSEGSPQLDKTILGWGLFLIVLGVLFLLQNIIPFYFLTRIWPLLFILLGAYLVYRAFDNRKNAIRNSAGSRDHPGEDR